MNVGSYLTRAAVSYPDNIAQVFGDKKYTYKEMNQRVNSLAAALRNMGLQKGDRIGIYQKNSHCFMETLFACFKLGCCAIPMNFRLHPKEVVYHLNDARAAAVFFSKDFNEDLKDITKELPHTEHYISQADPAEGQLDYEKLISDNWTEEEQMVDVDKDDLAWLFYTSGTTGRPKGAMLTHANLVATSVGWSADLMHLHPEDIALQAAPLSHGGGIHAIAVVAKAGTNIVQEYFRAKDVLEAIDNFKVTNFWGVPTMIKMLADYPEVSDYDLSSLKWVVYGGAPMYVEDLKKAIEKIGPVFVQIFGQGETPMTGTYLRPQEHVIDGSEEEVRRLLSAGIERTCTEVKIFDEEDKEASPGVKGEIVVRGPAVMTGYWERPEETEKTLRGGWLHTGDVGYKDKYGYIYLVDRSKDVIISGGANVYPRELEEVLAQHPRIHEVAVIGMPDEYWGEIVVAVVVTKPGLDLGEDDVVQFCADNLAGYKKPKRVEFLNKLPKSAYGKILKRELRDMFTNDKK
ncbi:long-chain fatty acid--CoA ligase [Metallumcola ferriviriculae]|uniref:Long-chain fatty acid--CoA ligase n=1 Tax=Metallumcola ferriviriculae TaxID=3039180 RepID=A0AAU0URD9_9FIRM|nr:long-chain fatty acid--CoA ligase [Desulfitibacteraceae bacterium MK1]